ncbi:MAG: Transcription factor WhiB [Actinomycetia bacterium]|nr:Transcription factor WhiB [Actinomycetes bacterium]
MFAFEITDIRDETWRADARCRDGSARLVELFYSEELEDIAEAKEFCLACPVRDECLAGALVRHEPYGVWGGQLVTEGKVVTQKRRRGRPRKVREGEAVPVPQVPEWIPAQFIA